MFHSRFHLHKSGKVFRVTKVGSKRWNGDFARCGTPTNDHPETATTLKALLNKAGVAPGDNATEI